MSEPYVPTMEYDMIRERVERRVTAHSSLQLCFFSFSFLASRKAKVSLECLSKSLTIGQHNLARSRGKSSITDLRWKSRARSSNFEKICSQGCSS